MAAEKAGRKTVRAPKATTSLERAAEQLKGAIAADESASAAHSRNMDAAERSRAQFIRCDAERKRAEEVKRLVACGEDFDAAMELTRPLTMKERMEEMKAKQAARKGSQ